MTVVLLANLPVLGFLQHPIDDLGDVAGEIIEGGDHFRPLGLQDIHLVTESRDFFPEHLVLALKRLDSSLQVLCSFKSLQAQAEETLAFGEPSRQLWSSVVGHSRLDPLCIRVARGRTGGSLK